MKKAEAIFATIASLAFILNLLFLVPYMTIVFVIAIGILAMLYFFAGGLIFKEAGQNALLPIIAGLVLSTVLLGILFKIQLWPFADLYIKAAYIGMLVVAVIMGLIYLRAKTYNASVAKRLVAYACICWILSLLPQFAIVDIKYRKHPAYRDALKNAVMHPTDTALHTKANAERIKMEKE